MTEEVQGKQSLPVTLILMLGAIVVGLLLVVLKLAGL